MDRTWPHGPRADRYFQTGAAVLCNAALPVEDVAAGRIDALAAAENLFAGTANLPFPVQLPAGASRDWGISSEEVSFTVVGLWPPIEATGSVIPPTANQYATLEWLVGLREYLLVSGEVLPSLAADGDAPFESLTTRVVGTTDADLPLEVGDAASTILISIESGPTRVRLLASPGRVRLLGRN